MCIKNHNEHFIQTSQLTLKSRLLWHITLFFEAKYIGSILFFFFKVTLFYNQCWIVNQNELTIILNPNNSDSRRSRRNVSRDFPTMRIGDSSACDVDWKRRLHQTRPQWRWSKLFLLLFNENFNQARIILYFEASFLYFFWFEKHIKIDAINEVFKSSMGCINHLY